MSKIGVGLLSLMFVTILAAPARAGTWDPYEGYGTRDLRWLGAAYADENPASYRLRVMVTVSFWRELDPERLSPSWSVSVTYSDMSGAIEVGRDGRFRIASWCESASTCSGPVHVRQLSPRALRFRVGYTGADDQRVSVSTGRDSLRLRRPAA